ncbi:MAG: hypothetical protein ACE5KX_03540 [Acidimicrobiia bacterium]
MLLGLPASGKSEIRRYLAGLGAEVMHRDLHLGPTVELDDYPYVHLMRRISQELRRLGHDPVFFGSDELPMSDPRDWGTLVNLLNEDYADLHRPVAIAGSAAEWLFDRYDGARIRARVEPGLGELPTELRAALADPLEAEAQQLRRRKQDLAAGGIEGRTILIEFSRGGPDGAPMPLPEPHGYRYSLGQLSEGILSRASILYMLVTPAESRRRNRERALPGPEGDASILHHGVPEPVMSADYGTDDLRWLLDQSEVRDTVTVPAHGRVFRLPVGVIDNRRDKTSFLRDDPADWPPEAVRTAHRALREALDKLVTVRSSLPDAAGPTG